jgi:hypothetical protein
MKRAAKTVKNYLGSIPVRGPKVVRMLLRAPDYVKTFITQKRPVLYNDCGILPHVCSWCKKHSAMPRLLLAMHGNLLWCWRRSASDNRGGGKEFTRPAQVMKSEKQFFPCYRSHRHRIGMDNLKHPSALKSKRLSYGVVTLYRIVRSCRVSFRGSNEFHALDQDQWLLRFCEFPQHRVAEATIAGR